MKRLCSVDLCTLDLCTHAHNILDCSDCSTCLINLIDSEGSAITVCSEEWSLNASYTHIFDKSANYLFVKTRKV